MTVLCLSVVVVGYVSFVTATEAHVTYQRRDAELGTPYGKEIERRMSVAGRSPADIAAALRSESGTEAPQFRHP